MLSSAAAAARSKLDAARLVPFRKGDPRDGDVALNLDLLRPVGVLHRLQRVAKRRKPLDIGGGRFGIARARGADGAREMRDRFGVREGALPHGQRCRVRPGSPLERVSRGNRCRGVHTGTPGRRPRSVAPCIERERAVEHSLVMRCASASLRDLQIRVGLIVERVQLFGRRVLLLRAASADRRLVSIDSFHDPTRVNVCDGMWSACGTDGASDA